MNIEKRYKELVESIEDARIFDGRNSGIDVYVCHYCGARYYTRYRDKGVTPYTILCRKCKEGTATHRLTIKETDEEVHEWIRPSLEQLKKMEGGMISHVLDGGLVLDDEV